MSAETSTWLNTNTLIGFTAVRGNAWHYRADEQGEQSNHYTGAIPVQDVKDRLFHWVPAEGDVTTTIVTADGVSTITDPTRKTIVRPDTLEVLGVFKQGFTVHPYGVWLVYALGDILDTSTSELGIGSAGLLKGGALAWVQVEVPETMTTPEGVDFRPFLSGATSLDGSLSSTYQTGAQLIVCDNTLSASLGEESAKRIKVKHSRKSIGKLADVRDALELIHTTGDDFAAQVAALCATEVSDKAWGAFLDLHVELPTDAGRGRTLAENKRDALSTLYKSDARVAPWTGTAFGVVQAVNTFEHHVGNVRGGTRQDRNALRSVTGQVDKLDASTLETLGRVLALA